MLTDMGNKTLCESLGPAPGDHDNESIAVYSNMKSNVTHVRGIARQGYCLPKECSQDDLNGVASLFVNITNNGLAILPQYGIHFNTLIFNEQSRVGMQFISSDKSTGDLQSSTQTGAAVVVLVLAVLGVPSIIANLYFYINHLFYSNRYEKSPEDTVIDPIITNMEERAKLIQLHNN